MNDRGPRANLFKRILQSILALLLTWTGGLIWFVDGLPREVEDSYTKTDGIVVLTGGSDRLVAGLDLLAAGMAKNLFVSGVGRETNRDELLRLSKRALELYECCVEIGKEALDTSGNALESMRWAQEQGHGSLRVVTASYHMPRSLIELGNAMPEVDLIANPVFPERVKLDRWWTWPGTMRLVAAEFNKYLVSLLRIRIAN